MPQRDRDLARVVHARAHAVGERRTLGDDRFAVPRAERAEHRRPRVGERRRVDRERERQAPRHEAESSVEADVVHGARHRLEADHRAPCGPQMLHARTHDRPAESTPLEFLAHRERPHPPFATRDVREVERGDPVESVAPEHRAGSCPLDRKAPDDRIERRHAHAGHPVAAVALTEGVAEQHVQRRQVLGLDRERPAHPMRCDVVHAAVPAGRNSISSDEGSERVTIAAPVRSSNPTEITRSSPSRTPSMCVITITCSKRS